MSVSVPSRLVPLGILFALQGAAFVLAYQTLVRHPETASAAYVPWVVALGFVVGAVLILWGPRAVPASLVLILWTFSVQLVLLPPGFSTTFKLLVLAPVLIETVLVLPKAWGPVLAMIELGFFLAGQGSRTAWGQEITAATEETLWGLGTLGTVVVGGAWALRSAFIRRAEVEAELVHLNQGVQQIVAANVGFQELAAAVEQTSMRRERLRITREIHDIVGYTLTNQTMVLQAAAVLLDRDHDKLRELLDSAQEAARSGLQEVRLALRQLRVGAEQPLAFLNRLQQLCRTFERATSVKVDLSGAQTPDNLPPALELVLYRMIQEGLTNAFLHGKASRVSVGLVVDEHGLSLHLADNGTGAGQVTEGIGLTGMRERLGPFGGSLDYRSGTHGFTVWAQVPRASLQEET
jgi:signal transduction histidine kinase